jgi:tRNA-splicing ligase RtcB
MSDKITGKDLINLGYEPSSWFGDFLEDANRRHLSLSQTARAAKTLVTKMETKAAAEAAERSAREIPLHSKQLPFQFNITVDDEAEEGNVAAVRATFEELMRTPVIEQGAVMPDACPAGPMGTIPVGGVIATRNAILPGAHSADICCSMTATIIDGATPAELMDAIHSVTHFGPGGRPRHEEFALPVELLEAFAENDFLKNQKLQSRARSDFGTCGDGNHFNFVGTSEATGKTVLVTHFGSRGPGALLFNAGMQLAESIRAEISPETLPANAWIPSDTDEGREYWAALQLIREWTKQSHAALHDAAIAKLSADINERHWNEHNFVFREECDGSELFWHAKGATPIHNSLLPDTTGTQIVPLNMSQPVLFIKGERNEHNLGFAPHGAGRNMSRTAHKKTLSEESDQAVFDRETVDIDARFWCGKIDVSELPSAYKNADRVQEDMARFGLCDVTDRILPHGAIMAGDFDADAPWRKRRAAKSAAAAKSAPKG